MSKKETDIVSYITIIGWLISYFGGSREESKFHLNQSLVIILAGLVAKVASGIIASTPIIGKLIMLVVNLTIFVFWLVGLIRAIEGDERPLPFVGEIQILK